MSMRTRDFHTAVRKLLIRNRQQKTCPGVGARSRSLWDGRSPPVRLIHQEVNK
jgi:hypothetical protein